jgi:RNA polymerase sigma factor (sigma-70 family)
MAGAVGALPDAELVRRFADRRDEAAFEVLVWRHGPMVWSACRRALGHHQDAEDAFQAAFLALARTARRIGSRQSVGAWLHRVALNAALKLRASRRPAGPLPELPGPPDDPAGREFAGAVDEELDRLPEHYRSAFVLCCLEGMTNAEAARELGCPVGTVDSRLHAARARLRERLSRRGFGPAALVGLGAVGTAPPAVLAATIAFAADPTAAAPAVARLASRQGNRMTRGTMTITIAAASLAVALAGVAVWAFAAPPADPPTQPTAAPVPPAAEVPGPALLFVELVLKPGETGSRTLRLVRVPFRGGKPAGREDVFTADASEVGFQANHRVVADRHVVLKTATVIDVTDRKVLHTFDGGQVLRVEGEKVYFYSNKVTGEQGVFCFDLATRKRDKVAEIGGGRWGLRGVLSPDGTKAVIRTLPQAAAVLAGAEMPYGLALERVGKPRESLGDDFASTCGATGSGFTPEPPGVWLDDDRFVTQTTLGKLVVLNTATGKREVVVEIPPTHRPGEKAWDTIGASGFTPLGLQQPRFSLLPDGRVLYEADVVYAVDVARKTWEKPAWRPLGHGFESSALPEKVEDVDRYTKRVTVSLRHRGRVIGTGENVWWTTPQRPLVAAADGHLAVLERVQRPGKVVPTDAVRVWTAATGGWVLLDGWADSLIGWVK